MPTLFLFLLIILPIFFINLIVFGLVPTKAPSKKIGQGIVFKTHGRNFKIQNIHKGVSVIGAAGSGKTESILYQLLEEFAAQNFGGIIHDFKDFELTEMAYPFFEAAEIPFYTFSPYHPQYSYRINPIAPDYLEGEEAVNEIARVLMDNLLEKKSEHSGGSSKFFEDATEGLLAGIIWTLKELHPNCCTLPHIIALFSSANQEELQNFLSQTNTVKIMASAYLNGIGSSNQTAGVVASLANALKKIATKKLFMLLSDNEVDLDLNRTNSVLSIVNFPKYSTTFSPVLALIMHTAIKQMSVQKRKPSFVLLEEAPTIRLLRMHQIPATMRAYAIATIYVMQDKIQNDLLYGREAGKAILSNLSYQFFGKVNDPDTAKYYENFFEIIKEKQQSISSGGGLAFDTRISTSKKDVAKIRSFEFFKLKPGEFVAFADGIERKIRFIRGKIKRKKPPVIYDYSEEELHRNYNKIFEEAKKIIREPEH